MQEKYDITILFHSGNLLKFEVYSNSAKFLDRLAHKGVQDWGKIDPIYRDDYWIISIIDSSGKSRKYLPIMYVLERRSRMSLYELRKEVGWYRSWVLDFVKAASVQGWCILNLNEDKEHYSFVEF